MWLMLQQAQPDDYVIATGESHSVKEFIELAFEYAGLDWQEYVIVDETLKRPAEVEHLVGDSTKAKKKLGWEARTSFKDLVKIMLEADIKRIATA
jgi:GDPmannose 4,6-dehydratase